MIIKNRVRTLGKRSRGPDWAKIFHLSAILSYYIITSQSILHIDTDIVKPKLFIPQANS